MKYNHNTFSITGEHVLSLGLGTHGHGHAYGGISREESLKIFDLIFQNLPKDSKVFIDTAPRYGHGAVETWIGEFLSSKQNQILIATKGGRHIEPDRDNEKDFSNDFLRFDLDNSLMRLKVDQIFLYQLHNPSIEIIKNGTVFETLEKFRSLGLIQWYGVSINNPEEGIAVIETCKRNQYAGLVAIQVIYNVLNKSNPNLEVLFQLATDTHIAIITREVLLRGFLSTKYNDNSDFSHSPSAIKKIVNLYGKSNLLKYVHQVDLVAKPYNKTIAQTALRFSIQNPHVTVTLVGINRAKYFDEDWGALDANISPELLANLNAIDDLRALSAH